MNREEIANPMYLDGNSGDYAHFGKHFGKLLVDERLSFQVKCTTFESLF